LRSIIRRLGDTLTACVANDRVHYNSVLSVKEPNFFVTTDQTDDDHDDDNDEIHHLTDFDPSKLLDHWLRELDFATMNLGKNNQPSLGCSLTYPRKYKRQRSMIDVNTVEDSELLEILDDLSDLELQLEEEIEIVHHRQEAARAELEMKEKIKAENIQIAIEKIKEASIKKMYVKVFTSDGCAKSLLVDETMSVGQVTRILSEKNLVNISPLWALVELAPDLHIERVYEDHELLVENCLLWKPASKNTLWFMERPEKYDIFQRPQEYFEENDIEHYSKQELFDKYFSDFGSAPTEKAPLEVTGNVWLKTGAKKSWSKHFCVLKSSGLYYTSKKTSELILVTTFDVNQVYYGVNWKTEHKAPSQFCFGVKHPHIQVRNCKNTKYFCVETEMELHRWVTGIRMVKNGAQICDNYRDILEDMDLDAHQDYLDNNYIVTRYVTEEEEKLLTPTSETDQNSFDSGVSSRAASDISDIKTRIMTEEAKRMEEGGYVSDYEEDEPLPPHPAESITSLHCCGTLPPPPVPITDTTLLLIPAKTDSNKTFRDSALPKEQSFRTFFEDVWFEESSYQA